MYQPVLYDYIWHKAQGWNIIWTNLFEVIQIWNTNILQGYRTRSRYPGWPASRRLSIHQDISRVTNIRRKSVLVTTKQWDQIYICGNLYFRHTLIIYHTLCHKSHILVLVKNKFCISNHIITTLSVSPHAPKQCPVGWSFVKQNTKLHSSWRFECLEWMLLGTAGTDTEVLHRSFHQQMCQGFGGLRSCL